MSRRNAFVTRSASSRVRICVKWSFTLVSLVAIFLAPSAARAQSTGMALRESAKQASPAQIAQAAAQLCPPNTIVRGSDGRVTGCRYCPAGTEFHGFFKNGPWGIDQATIGHFLSSASSSIMVDGTGCDPHSNNFGGTYVFSLQAGRPKLLRYNPGLMTSPCRQLRLRNGRDFLVCEGEGGAQGYVTRYIYSVRFAPDGKGSHTFLFMTHDTVRMCGETVEGKPDGPIQRSRIIAVNFPGINADGAPGLSVTTAMAITATLGRKSLSAKEREACLGVAGRYAAPVVPVKTYRINYVFDGFTFQPTPASRKNLKLFDKLSSSQ